MMPDPHRPDIAILEGWTRIYPAFANSVDPD